MPTQLKIFLDYSKFMKLKLFDFSIIWQFYGILLPVQDNVMTKIKNEKEGTTKVRNADDQQNSKREWDSQRPVLDSTLTNQLTIHHPSTTTAALDSPSSTFLSASSTVLIPISLPVVKARITTKMTTNEIKDEVTAHDRCRFFLFQRSEPWARP
ncbi:hypothetical protein K435DRAFT_805394 [Dendrothele bispora CBS 962.96]|uniref:Uncharacterized protein n=1 Tax=Dendrothele bispora (strain CBS 962.96) TaxID=1314807 RepID=A0A4S8LB33_DENBC|nr:hypothetical protein K435DRAFT_805394 [Dendrothele bispora CBS 962.96]